MPRAVPGQRAAAPRPARLSDRGFPRAGARACGEERRVGDDLWPPEPGAGGAGEGGPAAGLLSPGAGRAAARSPGRRRGDARGQERRVRPGARPGRPSSSAAAGVRRGAPRCAGRRPPTAGGSPPRRPGPRRPRSSDPRRPQPDEGESGNGPAAAARRSPGDAETDATALAVRAPRSSARRGCSASSPQLRSSPES